MSFFTNFCTYRNAMTSYFCSNWRMCWKISTEKCIACEGNTDKFEYRKKYWVNVGICNYSILSNRLLFTTLRVLFISKLWLPVWKKPRWDSPTALNECWQTRAGCLTRWEVLLKVSVVPHERRQNTFFTKSVVIEPVFFVVLAQA